MTDLLIIGSGPAGLSAAIYAARYMMDYLVIGQLPGGLISTSHKVENYPGFSSISGWDLAQKFEQHAISLGTQIVMDEIISLENTNEHFVLNTNSDSYSSKAVILATGQKRRKLNIPGESELEGKGVSYCATCDGAFYRDKTVAVIGGSNTACEAALYMADVASKVYLIYRRDALRAEPADVALIEKNPKIEVIYNTNVTRLLGEGQLESLALDRAYKEQDSIDVDGVFIEIGSEPDTRLAFSLGIELDEGGYLKVDQGQRTNIPLAYAAGDCTTGSDKFQQVITAAAEGAIAAMSAYYDLKKS